MQVKRKNGLKIAAITIALLLCLALAVGITGAWYQAKRQATGTLSMDQGIIIDYKGFGQTPDEGIWSRDTTTTFLLFDETNAQPGEEITVNAAGIRANEKSVNFYARVKLSYKFYNGETPVELADATKLIKTSSSFFGTNWVDGGGADGYYYYATGTTLNTFAKTSTTFVDLFATDAKFIIEGEGFVGADNNGEGGGFVVGDTSINKIEVYLTLETLQGDADAAAEGWKISSQVDFAKVDEGKIVKSNTTEVVTDEQLNVTINGKESKLEEVKFPYDEEVTLNFDSRNVDYITLNYSNGESETFGLAAEDFANDYLSETALKVTAKSSKGTVKGYTVGLWNDSEYDDFIYSNNNSHFEYDDEGNTLVVTTPMESGICLTGYFGNDTELIIPASVRVRERDFKTVVKNYSSIKEWKNLMGVILATLKYPCTLNSDTILNSMDDLSNMLEAINGMTDEEFLNMYPKMEFVFKTLCVTTSILYSKQEVKELDVTSLAEKSITSITIPSSVEVIDESVFAGCSNLENIVLEEGVKTIGENAFGLCTSLTSFTIPSSVSSIGKEAFRSCENLTTLIGEGWVKVEDGSAVDASTLLKDIDYDIKRA